MLFTYAIGGLGKPILKKCTLLMLDLVSTLELDTFKSNE
jgi:hypothetical protein